MIERVLRWYFSQPQAERITIIVWLISLVGLLMTGVIAHAQRAANLSMFYFLICLVIIDSCLLLDLRDQLPTIRIAMLTLIVVLELGTTGYYLLERTLGIL